MMVQDSQSAGEGDLNLDKDESWNTLAGLVLWLQRWQDLKRNGKPFAPNPPT
jgi:hypothetical protein